MPYDVVLGPIKGDWYDAAKLYRQWALQQKWCAAGSLQQRAQQGTVARHVVETDFWIRPSWRRSRAARANPNRAPPVPPKLGAWWYEWEKETFDSATPNFDPRDGVKEAFTAETAMGLSVMPYVQFQAWDTSLPTYDERVKAATVRQLDGEPVILHYNPKFDLACLCPTEPPMSDAGSRLAAFLQTGLGANGIYLDTFPPQPACYSPDHQHPFGPGGHWAVDADRAIAVVNFDNHAQKVTFFARDIFPDGQRRTQLITARETKDWQTIGSQDKIILDLPPNEPQILVFKS
jgi:hypothetical protein